MSRWRRFRARVRQRIGMGPIWLTVAVLMGWYGIWLLAGAAIQVARYVAS